MKKIFNEGNPKHKFILCLWELLWFHFITVPVPLLKKVTVSTVPVSVSQHCSNIPLLLSKGIDKRLEVWQNVNSLQISAGETTWKNQPALMLWWGRGGGWTAWNFAWCCAVVGGTWVESFSRISARSEHRISSSHDGPQVTWLLFPLSRPSDKITPHLPKRSALQYIFSSINLL